MLALGICIPKNRPGWIIGADQPWLGWDGRPRDSDPGLLGSDAQQEISAGVIMEHQRLKNRTVHWLGHARLIRDDGEGLILGEVGKNPFNVPQDRPPAGSTQAEEEKRQTRERGWEMGKAPSVSSPTARVKL